MRTTVTLDADTHARLRKVMEERGIGFKEALNDALRRGLAMEDGAGEPFRFEPRSMGTPAVPLDRALRLAADLEDDELLRRQEAGR